MGTCFYSRKDYDPAQLDFDVRSDPKVHIGKRSAAGWYCWDCGITLCKDGKAGVHLGRSNWLEVCPICRKSKATEDLNISSVGRELGFCTTKPQVKTGVASCCSFSWAMPHTDFAALVNMKLEGYDEPDKVIVNEYGDLFTMEEFLEVLKECPIQFFDTVGDSFQ